MAEEVVGDLLTDTEGPRHRSALTLITLSNLWDRTACLKLQLRYQDMVSMKFQKKSTWPYEKLSRAISGLLKFLTYFGSTKGLRVDFQMVFCWWELLPSCGSHCKWAEVFASGCLFGLFCFSRKKGMASKGQFREILMRPLSSLSHQYTGVYWRNLKASGCAKGLRWQVREKKLKAALEKSPPSQGKRRISISQSLGQKVLKTDPNHFKFCTGVPRGT